MLDPRKHNASATRNLSPSEQPPNWPHYGGDCRGPSSNGQPQWARTSPRPHDTGSESETDDAHVSRLGRQQPLDQSAVMEELLRTRREVFHAQVVRLLTAGNCVQHLSALSQVIDLINQAVAVAECAQQTSSAASIGIASSAGSPAFPSWPLLLRRQPPPQEVKISSPPSQPINNGSYPSLPSLRSLTYPGEPQTVPQHTVHHQCHYHHHQYLHSQTHQHPSSSSSSSATSVASPQFSAPMQLLSPRMLVQESRAIRGMSSPRSPQQENRPTTPTAATISSSSSVEHHLLSSRVMSPPQGMGSCIVEKEILASRNADASPYHQTDPASSPPSSSSSSTSSKPLSTRRGVKRHKRSAFQKDKDARELLQRMRNSIGEDVVWAPEEWIEMQPLDSSLSLSKFNAQHWPEVLRLYRAAIPPKLWDALRFGRAMEFVYQKCLREPRTERAVEGQGGEVPNFTWKRWLQTYCIPHGINVQVANRNRRMWRVVRSYPLMQFSSVSLRELNKNVCGISRYLSTDPEAREFWSQSFKGFVSSLPASSMPASPNTLTTRGKRKRAAPLEAPSSAVHLAHYHEDTSSLDLLASATIKNELKRDDDEDEDSDDSDALTD